jgi:hypothetical protein
VLGRVWQPVHPPNLATLPIALFRRAGVLDCPLQGVSLARRGKKRAVFDHVDLPVSDIEAATRFYRIVLGPLGYQQTSSGRNLLDPDGTPRGTSI